MEGQIEDPSSAVVPGAEVSVHNAQTALTRTEHSSHEGSFHFSNLPVGEYSLTVNSTAFAPLVSPIRIDIGQVVTYPVTRQVAGGRAEVNVTAQTVFH